MPLDIHAQLFVKSRTAVFLYLMVEFGPKYLNIYRGKKLIVIIKDNQRIFI